MQWNLSKARSENFEIEYHPELIPKRSSVIRLLSFVSHGEMGSYSEAVGAYLSGQDSQPDLTKHIHPAQTSYGFGLNGEQEINDYLRVFGRLGWNERSKEIFQFAEADRTLAVGTGIDGKKWHREGHHAGLALAINGLTPIHRQYLSLGGTSYLLGDSRLNYGHEAVLEGYYNVRLFHGVFGSLDVQHIWNPGFNQDRGPVLIFGLRLHFEADAHFN